MSQPRCPACDNSKSLQVVYKDVRTAGGDIVRCGVCGMYFTWPPPHAATDPHLYEKKYYDAWAPDVLGGEGVAALKHATFEHFFDVVSKHRSGGRVLDVGCGFGHLLEVARRRGWDGYGIEASIYAAEEARKTIGGGRIVTGDFLTASLPCASFDVITMVDLIEHIGDVRRALARCAALLNERGLLVIVTPDMGSMSRKWFGRYWPHFNKEHAVFFSTKVLQDMLQSQGFRVVEASAFPKALNLYYIRGGLDQYGDTILRWAARAVCLVMPDRLKRRLFFIPQGELVIVAEKCEGGRR